MQLDPRIILGIQQPQIESPTNALAGVLQVQGAMNQNRAFQSQQEAQARALQRQNQLQSILAISKDPEKDLLQAGYITEAGTLGKNRRDNQKTEGEIQLQNLKATSDRFKLVEYAANGVNSPETHAQAVRLLRANNLPPDALGEVYDPAHMDSVRKRSVTEVQKIDQQLKEEQFRETQTQNTAVRGNMQANQQNQAGQLAVSQGNLGVARGNLGVAQNRLAFDQASPRGVPLETANGPVLVDPRTGQARPITLGGAPVQSRPTAASQPNEGQSNAALYSRRMLESDQILNQLEGQYSRVGSAAVRGAQGIPGVGGLTGAAANALASPEMQQAEQAERNFLNATLRRESGAAIAPSEFDSGAKQYFPRPGDSPQVIAQKASNRRTAIEGINNAAGPAKVTLPSSGGTPSRTGPQPGTVQDGYRFKGGDPSQPSAWEKVS